MRMKSFSDVFDYARDSLLHRSMEVHPETWQSIPTAGKPEMLTHELQNFCFSVRLDDSTPYTEDIKPNLPWAAEHFNERVSGSPLNPPPSWIRWPWSHSAEKFKEQGQFSHSYPERFWPLHAGMENWPARARVPAGAHKGIRFRYGDLQDVVDLLKRSPLTRQAYLPIFFPEDTGAHHGERIPCTLGYHFMQRQGKITIWYFIRSCDFTRHFRDDCYFAVRLLEWVRDQVGLGWKLGDFHMTIASLHMFHNDWLKEKN